MPQIEKTDEWKTWIKEDDIWKGVDTPEESSHIYASYDPRTMTVKVHKPFSKKFMLIPVDEWKKYSK